MAVDLKGEVVVYRPGCRPWFHQQQQHSTTSSLRVRICSCWLFSPFNPFLQFYCDFFILLTFFMLFLGVKLSSQSGFKSLMLCAGNSWNPMHDSKVIPISEQKLVE